MKSIRGPALFMNGEWCINSLNMYMYITWERTCPIACHIDSGVSYETPAWSIKKKTSGDGTQDRLSCIDGLSRRMHGHSWEVAEFELACFNRSRVVSAHAADFVWERSVRNNVRGKTKMWCQLTLLKESYQCYWILSLIWFAITLHLPLTTLFSIQGSFTSSSGLVRSENHLACRQWCSSKQTDK